ncbi:MAG: hypothetical protein N2747_01770 [Chitinophagaceae bacterium]|nr:hypothetical protein [Chitinophagaceae bacterium]
MLLEHCFFYFQLFTFAFMRFSDVIGQDAIKKQLISMFHRGRLSHALLFLGKEGSGALPLALAFAQYINCETHRQTKHQSASLTLFETSPVVNPQPPEDSCGQCPSCIKAAKSVHPDIHYSYPTVTRKAGEKPVATDFIVEWRSFVQQYPYGNLFDWIESIKEKENSQGKITAEECNDIVRKLSLKSYESEYKILILWMPEELDKEGNKLLKIIEEPPPKTVFILVAENEERILPTLVSRCQMIRIPALTAKEVEEALVSRNHTEPAVAARVAAVCEGNYRAALQMVQHAEEDWQALLRDWLNAILKKGPAAQNAWIEQVNALGREKQKQLLRYFNHLLHQAILLYAGSSGKDKEIQIPATQHMLDSEKDFAERINRFSDPAQQQAILQELDNAIYYLERNANAKMLFHALTIKIYHIIKNKVVFLSE